MRQVAQFVGILLLIGFVGAYFWPMHSQRPRVRPDVLGRVARAGIAHDR